MFKDDLIFLTVVAIISTSLLFFILDFFYEDRNLLENFIVKEFLNKLCLLKIFLHFGILPIL